MNSKRIPFSDKIKTMYKLIKVSSEANNNKYYNLSPSGDEVIAEYGRVGASPQIRKYPLRQMESKRAEKLRKGYIDITHLSQVATSGEVLVDSRVRDLYELLTKAANKSASENYVSTSGVTQVMIDEAQSVLNSLLVKPTDVDKYNRKLQELFHIIPRQMKNVGDFLYKGDHQTIVQREQDALDALAGQVSTQITGTKSLEEAFGIQIQPTNDDDVRIIKERLKNFPRNFEKSWKLCNLSTQDSYQKDLSSAKNKKTDLLWHGSRNENWLSIATKGLRIRPTNAIHNGSMFGDGIYFADKAQKSWNYTSHRGSYWANGTENYGLLALYSVRQGKQMEILRHKSDHYSLSKSRLGEYDSVFAKGGADLLNNEYIIYDGNQCTIEYIIKLT